MTRADRRPFLSLLGVLPLFFLSGTGPADPLPQDADEVNVECVDDRTIERIPEFEKRKAWRELYLLYGTAFERNRNRAVRVERRYDGKPVRQWINFLDYLIERFSGYPQEAFEPFRLEHDAALRQALERARGPEGTRELEELLDRAFFSGVADEAMDFLANRHFHEGRIPEAIYHWNRLLRFHPDSDLPRPLIVARLLQACAVAGNRPAFDRFAAWASERGIRESEEVILSGAPVTLGEVTRRAVFESKTVAVAMPERLPYLLEPGRRPWSPTALRKNIYRWDYVFPESGRAQGGPTVIGEYPLHPAYARIGEREFLVFTDGSKTVAVDPRRVQKPRLERDPDRIGMYWEYPEQGTIPRPRRSVVLPLPDLGCTIAGDAVYVTMYSERGAPEQDPAQQQDGYVGPTSMKAFDLRTGRILWDTDHLFVDDPKRGKNLVLEQFGFYGRNWSFSGPPLIRGGRLFVGINTSPFGEQESWVLCLDAATGMPLWNTFVVSVNNANWRGGFGFVDAGGRLIPLLTTLQESDGLLFVQTGLGVAGALNPQSGGIVWLTPYKRDVVRPRQIRADPVNRPAQAPLLFRNLLLCLPQDSVKLLVFDSDTGQPREDLVELTGTAKESGLTWSGVKWMLPVGDSSFLLLGSKVWQAIAEEGKIVVGTFSDVSEARGGCGVVHEGHLYLPTQLTDGDVLMVLSLKSRMIVATMRTADAEVPGNLLMAGDHLVSATDRVVVTTDSGTLQQQYWARMRQSPPHPRAFLEHGDAMLDNELFEEAARSYLKFIEVASGDPAYESKIREKKRSLHGLFLKAGETEWEKTSARNLDRVLVEESARAALSHFRHAIEFSYDVETRALASVRAARACERLEDPAAALLLYQKVVEEAGEALLEGGESGEEAESVRTHASKRIEEILRSHGRELYAAIEREARTAVEKISAEDFDAVRRFVERYPNSEAAREAFRKAIEDLWKNRRHEKIRSALEEFRDRFSVELGSEDWKKLVESLEKLGDSSRLRWILPKLAAAQPEMVVVLDGKRATAKEHAQRIREEPAQPGGEAEAAGPLARLSVLTSGEGEASGVERCRPLRPQGVRPGSLPPERELFVRGSMVELWELGTSPRRVWSRARPGAYLGIDFRAGERKDPGAGTDVAAVHPGSPAAEAGIAKGDRLATVDGAPVSHDSLDRLLKRRKPGETVRIGIHRDGEERSLEVRLSEPPPNSPPFVMGSAYTSDYQLAVAWEDGTASLDLRDGGVRWEVRTGSRLGLWAVDAFLILHDGEIGETKDPSVRLACLHDATGNVRWVKRLQGTPEAGGVGKLRSYSRYFSDWVALLIEAQGKNGPSVELRVFRVDDGKESSRQTMNGGWTAKAFDPERGVLFWVDPGHKLQSVSLSPDSPSGASEQFDLPLTDLYFRPEYATCDLDVFRDHLVVTEIPTGQQKPALVTVFKVSDRTVHRRIVLPDGHELVPNVGNPVAIDDEGILYVYNEWKGMGAFVTAYRLDAPGTEGPLWDSPAPSAGPAARAGLEFVWTKGHVALFVSRGCIPGENAFGPVAVGWRKRGPGAGRLNKEWIWEGLNEAGTGSCVGADGTRLFVATGKGLAVYQE